MSTERGEGVGSGTEILGMSKKTIAAPNIPIAPSKTICAKPLCIIKYIMVQ
jgi:hypothetical protein